MAATPMSAGWSAASPERPGQAIDDVEREMTAYGVGEGITVPFWSFMAPVR